MNFETAFREYLEMNDFAKKYSHRIWPLNIIFMAPNATTDETQFDLHPEDVDWNHYTCEDLEQCWHDFCRENSFDESSIISIELKEYYEREEMIYG